MKRSKSIQLTLIASVAAAVTGCGTGKPPRRCVNADNQVVDDSFCQDAARPAAFYPYHWYYGGPHGYVPIGSVVRGGSTAVPPGGYSTPSSASGTSRGVIGGAGEAAAGGHGGGAHGGGAGE